MSAFIASPETFVALAAYAVSRGSFGYPGGAYDRVPLNYLNSLGGKPVPAGASRKEVAEYFADVLYQENIRSVLTRYPRDTFETAPGPIDKPERIEIPTGAIVNPPTSDPLTILHVCDRLEYQCCETDDWRQTPAFALLDAIRSAAIRDLPGYDSVDWTL